MALHQAAPQKPGTLTVLPAGSEQELPCDFHGASLRKNLSRIVQARKLRVLKRRATESRAEISGFRLANQFAAQGTPPVVARARIHKAVWRE